MNKKRILIVDDEINGTRLLRLNLEQTNHYVVQVENVATRALSVAIEFQPDLILLDVMLPQLDGGQLATAFQDHPKLKAVPIVFFTAAARKAEIAAHGGRIGGLPFLAKPADFAEVNACIELHLTKTNKQSVNTQIL